MKMQWFDIYFSFFVSILIVNLCSCNESILRINGLSRPFVLGMLYDARSETIIPGVTMWDGKYIENNKVTQTQQHSTVKMNSANSKSDKATTLELSAEMSLSALAGLFELSGSAEYMSDTKSTALETSIAVEYSSLSHFEYLANDILSNVTYTINSNIATHVVTGIMFGNKVIFKFTKKFTEEKDWKNATGSLTGEATILVATGTASGNVSTETMDLFKSTSTEVVFYGDVMPTNNPTTIEQAFYLYDSLPALLSGEDATNNAVPITVWLYPLSKIDTSISSTINSLSESLISYVTDTLDHLENVMVKCADLLSQIEGDFPNTYGSIKSFEHLVDLYNVKFKSDVSTLVVDIRNGNDESALTALLTKKEASSFSESNLDKIFDNFEVLVAMITSYTTELTTILGSSDKYIEKMLDPNSKYLIALEINTYFDFDLLDKLQEDYDAYKRFDPERGLYELMDALRTTKWKLSLYYDLYQNNKMKSQLSFLAYEIFDKDEPIGSEMYYIDSNNIKTKLKPCQIPDKPFISETELDSYTIGWTAPGNCDVSSISYYEVQVLDQLAEQDWKFAGTVTTNQFKVETTVEEIYLKSYRVSAIQGDWESGESDQSEWITRGADDLITCKLVAPSRGSVTGVGSVLQKGEYAYYSCDEGYTVSKQKVMCDLDFTVPTCRASACLRGSVTNGHAEREEACTGGGQEFCNNANFYEIGAKVQAVCDWGYERKSSAFITCEEDTSTKAAKWEPAWNQISNVCVEWTCDFDAPEHSFVYKKDVLLNSNNAATINLVYGESVTISCEDYYEMRDGDNIVQVGGFTSSCMDGGEMSTSIPTCEAHFCKTSNLNKQSYSSCSPDCQGKIKVGEMIKFTCDSSHPYLVGSTSATCRSNDDWSNTAPSCKAYCGKLVNNNDYWYIPPMVGACWKQYDGGKCYDIYNVKVENDRLDKLSADYGCTMTTGHGKYEMGQNERFTGQGLSSYRNSANHDKASSYRCYCNGYIRTS